ncbi:uncharacterized protein LOC115579849 [Xyrichtys novacula]|uniref:Uncharacterized protein LOC115579849 n=1 Tax=Xyrichtys novacula TaxID=13765 RepID=A0AAV1GPD5_XYRNO|nr:uncharacterized protein LOC115579849 [Xyrichtys novacula]
MHGLDSMAAARGEKELQCGEILDDQFGLNWLDLGVTNGQKATSIKEFRDDLKKTLTDTWISEVENLMDSEGEECRATNEDSPGDSPPVKCPRLLSRYKAHKKRSLGQDLSIRIQISKYFDSIRDSETDNALVSWYENRDSFPQLHNLALKVLSVPASSAPVERLFSRGGVIMRPHCARLSHRMLQSLMFLKCNETLL